jgi:ferrous iron transport protein A
MMTLNQIEIGQCVTIKKIKSKSKSRMYDLGMIPGSSIIKKRNSPLGDPCAYEIKGTLIALRNEDALEIVVE